MKEELKERLIKHIDYLAQEMEDYSIFETLTWEIYNTQRSQRRDVERWIENLINSLIDISKLILTAEGIKSPETYREIVSFLSLVKGFNKEEIEKLSQWVKLRNIVVHEYLDIRWVSIKKFIQETEPLYKNFLQNVRKYLKEQLKETKEEMGYEKRD
ncbi:MAG: HepT-like ribonuclease domain-containing protein [Nitrospirota bacterium]